MSKQGKLRDIELNFKILFSSLTFYFIFSYKYYFHQLRENCERTMQSYWKSHCFSFNFFDIILAKYYIKYERPNSNSEVKL